MKSSENALRVCVWGIGPHARKNLLPALANTPGVRVTGVCSRDASVVDAVSREYQCRAWTDSTAMLSEADADAVVLATPIGLHFAHGMSVLESGKHLFCEKPLTATMRDTEVMLSASRARALVVAEGLMYLYHNQFTTLAQWISTRRFGALHSVSSAFCIPPLAAPGFRGDPALGGGAFLDVGCYPISAIAALRPDELPTVDFAVIESESDAAADKSGRALLHWRDGACAQLEWRVGSAYRNEIAIWCAEGAARSERIFSKPANYAPVLQVRDVHGKSSEALGSAENHFITMFSAFRALTADSGASENERRNILRRAQLLDHIRAAATL